MRHGKKLVGVDMYILDRIRSSYKVGLMISETRYATLWVLAMTRRGRLLSKITKRKELHINFGCGNLHDPRFFNIDARPFKHVDLLTKSPLLSALGNVSAD